MNRLYVLLVLLSACGGDGKRNNCRHHCPENKDKLAEFQIECIRAGRSGAHTLAGDDQDVEDVVDSCRVSAIHTFCEWKCIRE
jgi:hypothetical protein